MAISEADHNGLVSQWALFLLRASPTPCTAMLDSCEMLHRYPEGSYSREFWLEVHEKTITYSGVRPRHEWELAMMEFDG